MNRYTIYCTEEQAIKAFELGGPLQHNWQEEDLIVFIEKEGYKKIPTAEEMIGWLEEKGKLRIGIDANWCFWCYTILDNRQIVEQGIEYQTRKEATLAAIDAALNYLVEKKGGVDE